MKKNISLAALIGFFALPAFLFSCKKEKVNTKSQTFEKAFNVTNFNRIYAGETFHLVIKKGNEFKLAAKGSAKAINQIQCAVDNNKILDITFAEYVTDTVEVSITMPLLVSLNLAGGATALVTGFQGQLTVLRAVFSGKSKGAITGTGINTNVAIAGFSELTITGATENIYGEISGDGKLNSYGLVSTKADLSLTGRARAYVLVQNTLFGSASDDSRLYYKGNPSTTYFETYGNGLIIHE